MTTANRPIKVICLGEILFDRLADQAGKTVSEVTSWTDYPGGAPANVACALAKLGTPSAFVGRVGKDPQGKQLVRLLESIGVDISGVQYDEQAPTRQVYVTRSVEGDRTFAGFGERRADRFADAYLTQDLLSTKLFLEAEYLVLGTLELAYPQAKAAVFRALELAVEHDLKIVLDVNWRPMFWLNQDEALPLIKQLWQYVDFLKLAKEEAEWLFNTANAGEIFDRPASIIGVLVSDGDAQVSYCLSKNKGTVEPIKTIVQDTTGAGDAFLAGFIHQLCRYGIEQLSNPQAAEDIVKYACAVGSLTTTKLGAIAAQPDPDEIDALLGSKKKRERF
ncbi:MAG: carbohydrate kinase [Cyanobacteria bacterium J06588_4]